MLGPGKRLRNGRGLEAEVDEISEENRFALDDVEHDRERRHGQQQGSTQRGDGLGTKGSCLER